VGQWVSESVGQSVCSTIGKRRYESRKMMPRLYPETNENQNHRFAQHRGSPRRGALAAGGESVIRNDVLPFPGFF
jgi:hypothetical protein